MCNSCEIPKCKVTDYRWSCLLFLPAGLTLYCRCSIRGMIYFCTWHFSPCGRRLVHRSGSSRFLTLPSGTTKSSNHLSTFICAAVSLPVFLPRDKAKTFPGAAPIPPLTLKKSASSLISPTFFPHRPLSNLLGVCFIYNTYNKLCGITAWAWCLFEPRYIKGHGRYLHEMQENWVNETPTSEPPWSIFMCETLKGITDTLSPVRVRRLIFQCSHQPLIQSTSNSTCVLLRTQGV